MPAACCPLRVVRGLPSCVRRRVRVAGVWRPAFGAGRVPPGSWSPVSGAGCLPSVVCCPVSGVRRPASAIRVVPSAACRPASPAVRCLPSAIRAVPPAISRPLSAVRCLPRPAPQTAHRRPGPTALRARPARLPRARRFWCPGADGHGVADPEPLASWTRRPWRPGPRVLASGPTAPAPDPPRQRPDPARPAPLQSAPAPEHPAHAPARRTSGVRPPSALREAATGARRWPPRPLPTPSRPGSSPPRTGETTTKPRCSAGALTAPFGGGRVPRNTFHRLAMRDEIGEEATRASHGADRFRGAHRRVVA